MEANYTYHLNLWLSQNCWKSSSIAKAQMKPETYSCNTFSINNYSDLPNCNGLRGGGVPIGVADTAWKVSKYRVFSGPYFPVFGLNTEIYSVILRIQSEYRKIRTRKNSVFGYFSHSEKTITNVLKIWKD